MIKARDYIVNNWQRVLKKTACFLGGFILVVAGLGFLLLPVGPGIPLILIGLPLMCCINSKWEAWANRVVKSVTDRLKNLMARIRGKN